MHTVRKSAIVHAPCERVFELVDGVERYPEFLPWCASAEVFERTPAVTLARFDVDYRGFRARIATRNHKEAPHAMRLELVEGPFERFRGAWHFKALGASGCRVSLELEYALSNRVLARVVGPAFGHIAGTLLERFVARAESAAGGPG